MILDWQLEHIRLFGNTVATKEQIKHRNKIVEELQTRSLSVIMYKKESGTWLLSTPQRKEEIGDGHLRGLRLHHVG